MTNETGAGEVRLLPIREVMRLTGLSKVTIWRQRREGIFPQPVHVSESRIRWRSDEITRWIEERPRVAEGAATFSPAEISPEGKSDPPGRKPRGRLARSR